MRGTSGDWLVLATIVAIVLTAAVYIALTLRGAL